jgi:hypothetical protein
LLALGNLGGGGSAALAAPATSVGDGPAGLAPGERGSAPLADEPDPSLPADEPDFALPLDALIDIAYNTVR